MNKKFSNLTDSIRDFLSQQDFSDLEHKTISELISKINVYHEELLFQNQEIERAKTKNRRIFQRSI